MLGASGSYSIEKTWLSYNISQQPVFIPQELFWNFTVLVTMPQWGWIRHCTVEKGDKSRQAQERVRAQKHLSEGNFSVFP